MKPKSSLHTVALCAALTTTVAYAQPARLQVIHNSADAAAASVDVYVNGGLLIDNFEFRNAWGFNDVPSGVALQVGIAPGSSTSAADTIPGLGATYVLPAGGTFVLVANGIVSGSGYSPVQPFDLYAAAGQETAGSPVNTDVLVFHGCTDAPVVDVYESGVLDATAVNDLGYSDFAGYLPLPTDDYTIQVRTSDNSTIVAAYSAPLATLGLQGQALVVLASGFLDPTQNSNGEAFGLWVALPSGGALVELPSAPIPTARLQVIHNSADLAAAEVDVYLNGGLLLNDFAFRTATPFVDVQAGVDLSVAIAPGTSTSVGDAIATFPFNLAANGTYVVVANGIVSGSGYSPVQPFDLYATAGQEAAGSPSNTDVLVFHGCTDAPVVDVFESGVLDATAVNDLGYSDFAGYLPLPTDDYTIQVRTSDNSTIVAAYSAPLASLGLQGQALVVLASGFLDPTQNSNGEAFGLWVALPSGGALVELPSAPIPTARLQVIHNSADLAAAEVDVYLNGGLLLNDFAFRTATPFVDVQAGVDLSVAIAPGTSTSVGDAIATFPFNLDENGTYVVVANGIVSGSGYSPVQPFDLYATAGQETSAAGTTGVLVFHGATDAPAVDVFESAVLSANAVTDLAYGEFDGYLTLPTEDYVLEIRPAGDPNTLIAYDAPLQSLGLDGLSLVVLASGFLDPSVNSNGEGFGLWVALPSGGALVPLTVNTGLVDIGGIENMELYPNPANEQLTVDLVLTDATRLDIEVIDVTGRTMVRVDGRELSSGSSRLVLPVTGLENGRYNLRLLDGNAAITLPFNVVR